MTAPSTNAAWLFQPSWPGSETVEQILSHRTALSSTWSSGWATRSCSAAGSPPRSCGPTRARHGASSATCRARARRSPSPILPSRARRASRASCPCRARAAPQGARPRPRSRCSAFYATTSSRSSAARPRRTAPRSGTSVSRARRSQSARRITHTSQVRRHLARQRGLSCHFSRSRRRAGTGPLPRRRPPSFTKQLRDSGPPADALVGKLNKDSSFALRRGTRLPK